MRTYSEMYKRVKNTFFLFPQKKWFIDKSITFIRVHVQTKLRLGCLHITQVSIILKYELKVGLVKEMMHETPVLFEAVKMGQSN